MDIFPTVVSIAGGKSSKDIEGVSFLPLLKGASFDDDQDRPFYFTRRQGINFLVSLTVDSERWIVDFFYPI
ncbi:MAG: hypothetical protein WD426_00250 [Anditalea sp.]